MSQVTSDETLQLNLKLIGEAAQRGDRCPFTQPHGPLSSKAICALYESGLIKSEIFMHNYRVITILCGEFAGLKTKGAAAHLQPFRVNGRLVKRMKDASSKAAAEIA